MKPQVPALGKILSPDQISELEDQLGLILPPIYRSFIAGQNGGKSGFHKFHYETPDDKQSSSVIDVLFGVSENKLYDLTSRRRAMRDRIPVDYVPIGRDVFGNIICLSVKPNDLDSIYIWHHDYEMDGEQSDDDKEYNIFFLAKDMDSFIDNLVQMPLED